MNEEKGTLIGFCAVGKYKAKGENWLNGSRFDGLDSQNGLGNSKFRERMGFMNVLRYSSVVICAPQSWIIRKPQSHSLKELPFRDGTSARIERATY